MRQGEIPSAIANTDMYYELVGTNVRLAGSMHAWPAEAGQQDLPAWIWAAYQWS